MVPALFVLERGRHEHDESEDHDEDGAQGVLREEERLGTVSNEDVDARHFLKRLGSIMSARQRHGVVVRLRLRIGQGLVRRRGGVFDLHVRDQLHLKEREENAHHSRDDDQRQSSIFGSDHDDIFHYRRWGTCTV